MCLWLTFCIHDLSCVCGHTFYISTSIHSKYLVSQFLCQLLGSMQGLLSLRKRKGWSFIYCRVLGVHRSRWQCIETVNKASFGLRWAHLVQIFLQEPALGHAQVDLCLSQTVPDLCHDAHRRLVAGESFLDIRKRSDYWNRTYYKCV